MDKKVISIEDRIKSVTAMQDDTFVAGIHRRLTELTELVNTLPVEENPMDEKLLSEFKLHGKLLTECTLVDEVSDDQNRLYVYLEPDSKAFYALAVEWCSGQCGVDTWTPDSATCRELFTLTAYWDGARHLEFNRNSDMSGYIYYPNLDFLISALTYLHNLELTRCDLD